MTCGPGQVGGQALGRAPRGSGMVCVCYLCSPSDPELRLVRGPQEWKHLVIWAAFGGCPIIRDLMVYPTGRGSSDATVNLVGCWGYSGTEP